MKRTPWAVVGQNGRGLAADERVTADVDVQMDTLSKALGAAGGYICGSRNLIDWLTNRARSFIYSTAPPPAIAAAALAGINFLICGRRGTEVPALAKNKFNAAASLVIGRWAFGD